MLESDSSYGLIHLIYIYWINSYIWTGLKDISVLTWSEEFLEIQLFRRPFFSDKCKHFLFLLTSPSIFSPMQSPLSWGWCKPTHICICIKVYKCIHTHVMMYSIHICICKHAYVCIEVFKRIQIHIYIKIHMCVCIPPNQHLVGRFDWKLSIRCSHLGCLNTVFFISYWSGVSPRTHISYGENASLRTFVGEVFQSDNSLPIHM